jgi:alpha-tubulin suppressor-like RCC1 family protein
MTRSLLLLGLVASAACFEPTFPEGVPCSELGNCPEGQRCDPVQNLCSSAEPVPRAPLALGSLHTCALGPSGAVRCWGWAQYGQLGHGDCVEAPMMTTCAIGDDEVPSGEGDVELGGAATLLAAGVAHNCALLADGTVRCWGRGGHGALGYGNTDDVGDDETPAAAGAVELGGVVVDLAAGRRHTCALLASGNVRCWGEADEGQLGYGNLTRIGDDESPASAGDIDLGGAAVQIAGGYNHTCALLTNGSVRCWGEGTNGKLGYASVDNLGDDEPPSERGDINLGGPAIAVTVGYDHTCALLATREVRCWGLGDSGQLGYGNPDTIGDGETPATVGPVAVGGRVVQVAAGESHTCALLDTGAVRCWGSGSVGRLGYGNESNVGDTAATTPDVAGDVDVGGTVVRVAAGGAHTCVRLDTGALRCWGLSSYGQLGYGNDDTVGDNETPASAGDVPAF